MSSCLSKLNPGKATGADGLSPGLLKISSSAIGSSLAKLFNFCIRNGVIPKEWKSANVTPVFKKGEIGVVSNYRPISVTVGELLLIEMMLWE